MSFNIKIFAILILASIFISPNAQQICDPIIFAYDGYLDFPQKDLYWQSFFKKNCIKLKRYYDIDRLVKELKSHKLAGAFLPAGGFYYLQNDPFYQGIANATIGKNKSFQEKSYLLVRKSSAISKTSDLKNKKWGYINHECTTSFFAPTIYLSKDKQLLKNFHENLVKVPGFRAQVAGISKKSNIDIIMLWDLYLTKELLAKTRILGHVSELPTPVVIFTTKNHQKLKKQFTYQLINYHPSNTWLYSGFTTYQANFNKKFWNRIDSAYKARNVHDQY